MQSSQIPRHPYLRCQNNYKTILEAEKHRVLHSPLLSLNYYFIFLDASRDTEKGIFLYTRKRALNCIFFFYCFSAENNNNNKKHKIPLDNLNNTKNLANVTIGLKRPTRQKVFGFVSVLLVGVFLFCFSFHKLHHIIFYLLWLQEWDCK